jgi:RNA polymerase sigma-70 factor (ECF subfamily)
MTRTDEAVTGSMRGSEASFAELYERHRALALHTAMAILGNLETAEEARQEAFLQAFRTLGRKHADVSFSTWLYRCVVWAARNQARRRRPPPAVPWPEEAASDLDRAELRLQLVAAMQELPQDLREALALRYYLDLPVEEVAQILGCRPGTVKSRCHRALGRLARSGHLAGFARSGLNRGEPQHVESRA